MKWSRTIEFVLVAAGLMLIAIYIAARVHSSISSRAAIQAFRAAQEAMANRQNNMPGPIKLQTKVDFSLWSAKRITAYERSLTQDSGAPLALLRVPKLRLEVPVFDGTDDLTLNRGVGRIQGTARPGEEGNIGIAGHRDGFFRGLKDIRVGDVIVLELPNSVTRYTVKDTKIVSPDQVEVLKNHASASLTMVTCYPFYFIGNAPQRFIVEASAVVDGFSNKAGNQGNLAIGRNQ